MSDSYTIRQLCDDIAIQQGLEPADVEFALNYLSYYYIGAEAGQSQILSQDAVSRYVREMQEVAGLEVTGVIDHATIKVMKFWPRCGCKDYPQVMMAGGVPRWGKKEITYWVERYVHGLSTSDQDDLMALAWNQWSAHADLKFTRVHDKSKANIIISVGRGRADQFDGPGNTLAWAYLPPRDNYVGQLLMRFDLDETWVKDSAARGILYLNVACHEFGHLLGLDHSRQPRALMAPYYSAEISKPQANDDVPRIVSLYGAAKPSPEPRPRPEPGPRPGGKKKIEILVDDLSDVRVDGRSINDFMLI